MKQLLLSTALGALAFGAIAQYDCSTGRYDQEVFANVTTTNNIQYGSNQSHSGGTVNLMMDIYEPTGDTASMRPLFIFAPGGNFITADKSQGDIVPLAQELARKGYVTACITYRVGFPSLPFNSPDSVEGFQAVMRGAHDSRAAVRYFRMDAAINGNTYKIDPNMIFFGGSSAGGFNALHLAYFDQLNEIEAWMDTTGSPGLLGGVEGNSGNPGYSSTVTGVVNISGALGDTAWMKPGDTPSLSFHGDVDGVVPFYSDIIYLLGQFPIMEVDGSHSVAIQANDLGINHCFHPYWGADHTPHWGGHPNETQFYDTTSTLITEWLQQFVCGYAPPTNCTTVSDVAELAKASTELRVYPNPTQGMLTLESANGAIELVGVFNAFGQLVMSEQPASSTQKMDFSALTNGLYLMEITTANGTAVKKVVLQ